MHITPENELVLEGLTEMHTAREAIAWLVSRDIDVLDEEELESLQSLHDTLDPSVVPGVVQVPFEEIVFEFTSDTYQSLIVLGALMIASKRHADPLQRGQITSIMQDL